MKKLINLLMIATLVAGAWSCSKGGTDEDEKEGTQAPTAITTSESSISASQAAGSYPLTITAPSRPKISSDSDWVTIGDGTFNNYSITFTVNVTANNSYDERSAVLTVTSGDLSKTVSVVQAGLEKVATDIAKTPVTSGISAKAKALYDYLLKNYGSKIVSSIMADVAWNHTEADKVYKVTGKYPAMNCYDFLHICVPENNWINYNDLTPVTEWADAGGIVSLMWHFNVPLSQSTTVGADGSGVTCTPSKTTFRAKNCLTSGTWENTWFYSEMDKVVNVILALQEKGIAALWRPFHEAAGNYYATAFKGEAWFWWGYDGPEAYKNLWNAMQDYFYSKGIRNLIWVWTAQCYNCEPSKYNSDSAYYPGDDRVDIVARDLYGQNAKTNYTEYVTAQTAYPHKMVTLGECGLDGTTAFASIPDVWSAGAFWSWFMPWYGSCMPDNSWWTAAMSSEYVITRDKLDL